MGSGSGGWGEGDVPGLMLACTAICFDGDPARAARQVVPATTVAV